MTANRTVNIINESYGYSIISSDEESALIKNRDIILSELGIGAVFEFLSYDVSEFSESRKTIHARRFYQLYYDIFSFKGFNMEAFHKIQAGCLFIVAMSGITRGLDDFEYSGFVKDALKAIGKISPDDKSAPTLNEKLFYIHNTFEKLSHISLGIYSLQIFTKFGMTIQKINTVNEGLASRLFYEIAEEIKSNGIPSDKIDMLLSLNIMNPEDFEKIIAGYIEFAISDISVQSLSHGRKKTEKANKKLADEITNDAYDALSGLRMDVTDLYNMNLSLKETKLIYESNPGNNEIAIMYLALLERYAGLFERLWHYEENTFIKRLNMIFINKVKEMFAGQRKQELHIIQNECVRIIEEGIPGITVYESEGFLNGLEFGGGEFAERIGIDPDISKRIMSELNMYLDANMKTVSDIRLEMKNNLKRILGSEGIPEKEKTILQEAVYGFDAIIELLTEE